MYNFVYPLDKWDEEKPDKQIIRDLINKHISYTDKLRKNKEYYDGKQDILNAKRSTGAPNNKTVCNHAKDIADVASGYFMGNPITFHNSGDSDIAPLLKAFDMAHTDDTDADLALELSISGVAYEYIYISKETVSLCSKSLNPIHTFMVKDDTIEENNLFACYYWKKKDDTTGLYKWIATIATKHYLYTLNIDDNAMPQVLSELPVEHYFGDIPIIEYQNNKFGMGDFEQQIPLIDAYNTLMSDRINDKEQFIDALLVLYGASLADDEDEANAAAKVLRDNKLLELPEDAKAEYLIRTLDETGVETLRKALKEDIYTFSHVPNLSDENFAGNTSGVAMEFKLLGLEMLTSIKTRYYKKGLRQRIKLFCNFLELTQILLDADSITATFARTLPKNLLELSQVIANLSDKVSTKTLLQLLPFVENPDEELEAAHKEQSEKTKAQAKMYGMTANTSLTQ